MNSRFVQIVLHMYWSVSVWFLVSVRLLAQFSWPQSHVMLATSQLCSMLGMRILQLTCLRDEEHTSNSTLTPVYS